MSHLHWRSNLSPWILYIPRHVYCLSSFLIIVRITYVFFVIGAWWSLRNQVISLSLQYLLLSAYSIKLLVLSSMRNLVIDFVINKRIYRVVLVILWTYNHTVIGTVFDHDIYVALELVDSILEVMLLLVLPILILFNFLSESAVFFFLPQIFRF